jgi:endonuclease-3
MPRESKRAKTARAIEICDRMGELYPHVESALSYTTPFTLVICVLLSAQTTDVAVNKVTPELFARWPDAPAMAQADLAELGEVIRSIGFWRSKAQHCVACAQMIVADYGGEVPRTMDELTRLPGVGRKTANIVLNKGFGIVEGIAVDTHVFRLATRWKLTNRPTPLQAERDLLAIIPRDRWGAVNEQWIHFGRDTCRAQRPLCDGCPLADICPSAGKASGNPRPKHARAARA